MDVLLFELEHDITLTDESLETMRVSPSIIQAIDWIALLRYAQIG